MFSLWTNNKSLYNTHSTKNFSLWQKDGDTGVGVVFVTTISKKVGKTIRKCLYVQENTHASTSCI